MQEVLSQMNLDQERFLSTLLDDGQASCFTESPNGYKVHHAPKPEDLFFCINALHPTQDLAPVKDWHSQYKPRRADANVVCHRNFLIELDDVPLERQISYVTEKVPVSSIVYSGGKSYHFIISLERPVEPKLYREYARRLHKLLPRADKACKNASRLSRLPNVIRPETGKLQRLYMLGQRVPNKEFVELLPELEPKRIYTQTERARYIPVLLADACTDPDEAIRRYNLGGRNAFFFWLHKRMEEAAFTEEQQALFVEQAYTNLQDVAGFTWEEACSAARMRSE